MPADVNRVKALLSASIWKAENHDVNSLQTQVRIDAMSVFVYKYLGGWVVWYVEASYQ